jgi:CheY-like chemotaxis protein
MTGSKVATIHAGLELAQTVKDLHPDLVLLDVSMPNLEKSGLERLKELAKDTKSMIILTGHIAEANSALLESSTEAKNKPQEWTNEGKTIGG